MVVVFGLNQSLVWVLLFILLFQLINRMNLISKIYFYLKIINNTYSVYNNTYKSVVEAENNGKSLRIFD